MNRSYSKIRHIQESNMKLETKRLLMEQTKVDKINLPDGSYIGDGSGYEYQIKSPQGQDTGYTVKAKVGIRGMVEKDPVTITSGVPTSKTWGQGGEYTFKDVGYKPQSGQQPAAQETQTVTTKVASEGVKNVTPEMISSPQFKGTYSGYVFGGVFNGVNYQWDCNGVEGMSGVRGMVDGDIITESSKNMFASIKKPLTDANPDSPCVGFYKKGGTSFIIYTTTDGKPKCLNF